MTWDDAKWESFTIHCGLQDRRNAELEAQGYSGVWFDLTVGSWAAWRNGVRLGWHTSREQAATLVRDQMSRDMKRSS